MKIISKTKDYYDFVQHVYGSDNTVIYDRDAEFPTNIKFHELGVSELDIPVSDGSRTGSFHYYSGGVGEIIYNVVICGKIYKVKHTKTCFSYTSNKPDINTYDVLSDYIRKRWDGEYRYTQGEHIPAFDLISRYIKQPIFMYERVHRYGKNYVEISDQIPNLTLMGFGKLLEPHLLYQDIEFYISNVINHGVGINPPVVISDKEKVIKHGFDVKQSFRHR